LISALEAAVASTPGNDALRVHLAELLVQTARFEEALIHATVVIGRNPVDVAALHVASEAARGLGKEEQAAAYMRIIDAVAPDNHSPRHQSARQTPDGREVTPGHRGRTSRALVGVDRSA